jgi:hypothetical protein
MRWRPLDIEEVPDPPRVWIPYLDQYPFAYAVRLQSAVAGGHEVTVRLFLVADEFFPERRMWIELDKFRHSIVGERSVAVRHARESAVIRKPATKPPGSTRHSPEPPGPGEPREWDAESYCECGWPYNLLLPRGTGEGMRFWMAAVVTDWAKDDLHGSSCGSMSFCGAQDRYPDARSMGYPFDRRFASADVATALDSLPSIATRSFTIRWTNASFPD